MISFTQQEEEQKRKLEELRKKQEEQQAQRMAAKHSFSYLDLFMRPINTEAITLVSEEDSRKAELAVIQRTPNNVVIALIDPENPYAKQIIENFEAQGYQTQLYIVSRRSLKRAQEIYSQIIKTTKITGRVEISSKNVSYLKTNIKNIDDLRKKFEEILSGHEISVSGLLEIIMGGSLALGASDIHLEAEEEGARIRYRLDGMLHDVIILDKKLHKSILMRIKLISGLKINVTDVPQDGRFTVFLDDSEIETRVSILPGAYGEGIVMRILDPSSISVPLEDLGFSGFHYNIIEKEIKRPNGMIIVTGPTGSGKTTTLYAFIKKLNSPEIKIITIEDPVEYHVEGLSQTQIKPDKGLTFSSALRSILRQDPDMILLGEMRDIETIETALHAALTGHLVFSTLHTNDAAGAIPRLIDSGANSAIIAPALNLIIAQRLIRRVCKKCSVLETPTKEEYEKLKSVLAATPENAKKENPQIDKDLKIAHTKKCPECSNTGYKGRVGIHELLANNDEMKQLIIKSPSQFEIKDLAKKQGMISMKEDGFLKILQGLTTIEEVENATG